MVDLHDRRTPAAPATPWWRRRSAAAAILRRDGALRVLVTILLLLAQHCSGFRRSLGRGILGCLRRLSRSCLNGFKALPARLRGGGNAPGAGGGHGGGSTG